MTVLHLLAAGRTGGIETLCEDYAEYSKHNNIFLFPWIAGEIAEEMKQRGDNVICLGLSKKNLKLLVCILKICKSEGVDAIVEHHSAPMTLMSMLLVKRIFPSIKLIMYAHCNADDMIRKGDKKRFWIYNYVVRKAISCVDVIVAISKSVKQSLHDKIGVDNNKIKIVYNGVNINKFKYPVNRFHEIPQIIYVGRLIKEKGVQVTLEALSQLPSDIKYNFVIVGDGNYQETLQTIAQKYNIDDRVFFVGKRRNVSEYLRESDIFIHMPIWEEGFGITIIEAMAAGLLCICAEYGGIKEIIANNKDGYLIEKGNAIALSQVLKQVLQRNIENEVYGLRVQAQKKADKFSVELFATALDMVIVEC